MSNLHFGTDIRIENLMLLEAMSIVDAEVIYDEIGDVEEVFEDAGIVMPVEELYDAWELREFFEEEGVSGFFGFACTPVLEMSECGKYIEDLSWGYYARFPVYGKDIDEFKKKSIEKVAAYRKKKIGNKESEG